LIFLRFSGANVRKLRVYSAGERIGQGSRPRVIVSGQGLCNLNADE
jgi:hypothetical protein